MDEAAVRRILKVAGHVQGGLARVLKLAEQIDEGQAEYKEKHWGQVGRQRVRSMPLPDVSKGITELGELVSLVYLTAKGRGGELVEYEHEFADSLAADERDGKRPILAFAPGGLVIVRGPSRYTVTDRGIEG
jgi:hypothetical protein